MRLKRLDIVGFKSFMDKTVVLFDDGITGIVGPNGCGKSNIVDAIRWVLGEQSAKHLRGGSMQDVIFNGSASRPPAGMAEVTLTFVNDHPDEVPARYRSFREIAVTRKLFRTGESEYLINRTPCRLMDITELFLGTGVGTKAYSIIEQGRIGVIVSAKPEDRRTLIEEAAGITRFKAKKRKAERKMEHTRTNLLRVGDLVTELKKRLDSLERQARKAERYKALKQELKEIEVHIAAHRFLEIAATRRALDRRLAALRAQEADLEGRTEALQQSIAQRRDRLSAEEARLAGLQERAAALEGEAKVCEERARGMMRERESLDARAKEAQEEMAALEARRRSLAEERARLEAAQVEIAELIEADRVALREQTEAQEAALQEIQRLDEEMEAERAGAMNAVRVLTEGRSHLAALERRLAEARSRREALATEAEALTTRLDQLASERRRLETKLTETRQLHLRLEEERRVQEETLARTTAELEETSAGLETARARLAERRSRLASPEEIQRRYEGYEAGVRAVMLGREALRAAHGGPAAAPQTGAEGGTGDTAEAAGQEPSPTEPAHALPRDLDPDAILGLVAEVLRAAPEAERALEAALGLRLQAVLVQDASTALRLAESLEASEAGRCTFLPLEGLRGEAARALEAVPDDADVLGPALAFVEVEAPRYEAVARHLLGNVVLVRDRAAASRLHAATSGLTFVALDGTVVEASGALTGGRLKDAGTGLLERRREIQELSAEVLVLARKAETLEATRERLAARVRKLQAGLKTLSRDAHSEQINLVSQEKEAHRLEDEIRRLEDERAQCQLEMEQLERLHRELEAEIARTQAAMEAAEREQATRQARLEALAETLAEAKASAEAVQDAVTHLRVKAAGDLERREALARELDKLGQTEGEIETRLRYLAGVVEGSGTSFERLDAQVEEDLQAAERLKAEAARLRTDLARGRETLNAALAAVKEDEAALAALREAHEACRSEAHGLAMEDRELALEARHLAEAVEERYAARLEDEVYRWHLAAPPTEADLDRLAALRAKVERMGEVNLTAISEFEALSERYRFLSEQKADLEASLDRLERAIVKINRTSQKRFVEAFEAVNERFQKIFPRLFNGGKAGLALTDPSNPLESGVEIFAQPPGKKLQSVNLLSGGEKALTAVSLLFAIFLVKPTPFCLLDEVDAPLDDNNVVRYNQIVQEMSLTSQFILITHNKLTMEIADTMYGVTMEEPGCSKLVSVRLSGEEADAERAPSEEAAVA